MRDYLVRIIIFPTALFLLGCTSPTDPSRETERRWELTGLVEPNISTVLTHPDSSKVIYIGSRTDYSSNKTGNLLRSDDGGQTWNILLENLSVSDVEMSERFDGYIFVTSTRTVLNPPGIYRTRNYGLSWDTLSNPDYFDWEGPSTISVHPDSLNSIILGVSGYGYGGIYKSYDGGNKWNKIVSSNVSWDKVTVITRDPSNAEILYAGTDWVGAILKSTDNGESWEDISTTYLGIVNDIVVSKEYPASIFVASSEHGIWKLNDVDKDWKNISINLGDSSSVFSIALETKGSLYVSAMVDGRVSRVYSACVESISWRPLGNYVTSWSCVLGLGADGTLYVGSDWLEKY